MPNRVSCRYLVRAPWISTALVIGRDGGVWRWACSDQSHRLLGARHIANLYLYGLPHFSGFDGGVRQCYGFAALSLSHGVTFSNKKGAACAYLVIIIIA